MIRSWYRTADGLVQADLLPGNFPVALQDSDSVLWVDIVEEPASIAEPILQDIFGFHPLAVDDALQESHVPKVDDWGEYLYLVLHAVVLNGGRTDTVELDLFVGRNYLVTYQARSIAAVERVWAACQRDERYLQKGVGRLLYQVADELVADYMPVIEALDEVIDQIEDQVFGSPRPPVLERIFNSKRALLHLRRIITHQREVLNKLGRGDYAVIASEDRVFFRDVYDHLVRLYDLSESLRDLVGGALETYLSVVNNRMNDVMKTLTVITTLFMPLSFVAGFFGMNFFLPRVPVQSLMEKEVFAVVILAMVITPIVMYWWMRRRAWL